LNHENTPSDTSFFTIKFLVKNNMAVVPTHPTFPFPRWKTKLTGRHFDAIEMIGTESRAVLNTLTEHYFQDAFKDDKR
jgi:hypothetical protein